MLFKYSICEIPGRGKGIVADEFIAKGSKIWELPTEKCLFFKEKGQLLNFLQEKIQEEKIDILEHIFCAGNEAILLLDDTEFTNHDSDPNTESTADHRQNFALRDIYPGEEMTEDYTRFHNLNWFTDICEQHGIVPSNKFPEVLEKQ